MLRKTLLKAIAIVAACSSIAFGQSAAPRAFELVSIKPTQSVRVFRRECRGDRFAASGVPVSWIVRWSYQVSAPRIVGLPDWTGDRQSAYDIVAKAPSAMTEAQCRAAVQSLLEDRFRLAVHREQREMHAYSLIPAKKGVKIRQVAPGEEGGVTINGAPFRSAGDEGPSKGLTMAAFAAYLEALPAVGLPVVDETGLAGAFSFDLSFSVRENDDLPQIWAALQEQLGLRLAAKRARVEVLAVDHIERPAPN